MKILVTGATGFIGNHVINNLLSRNYDIIATSTNEEKAKSCKWYPKVKYLRWDLEKSDGNLFEFFGKPDILIHIAWGDVQNPQSFAHIEKHLLTHYSFLLNLIENGLQDITITGTSLEYGLQEGYLHEKLVINPTTPYGISKNTLRKLIDSLHKKYKFKNKWVRLFYMFGDGQSETSIIPQLDHALKNKEKVFNMSWGEQLRDYLPVKKVAEYIVEIATQTKEQGVFNCCSGKPISIRRLVEEYIKSKKKKIEFNRGYYPYKDYEPMAFWGDNRKLLKILNSSK